MPQTPPTIFDIWFRQMEALVTGYQSMLEHTLTAWLPGQQIFPNPATRVIAQTSNGHQPARVS